MTMKKTKKPVAKKTTEKAKTEWVLVDTISTFRMRYCVEVPAGKNFVALNKVSALEAKEFSQLHIGEQVVSHRVLPVEEAIKICRQDNDYVSSWTDTQLVDSFFHSKKCKVVE